MTARKKRNVEDVDYAEADGNRPMREVLRDRHVAARKYTRRQIEAAYRSRARAIAMLQSCLCCFPLALAETPSGHEAWCPSEHLRRSFEAVDGRTTETPKSTDHGRAVRTAPQPKNKRARRAKPGAPE